jgi:hypothetical protein
MTDPKWQSDPRDQEQAVERRPDHQDPTAVDHTRESDASTINNGGLGGGRPAGGARRTPERARAEGEESDPVMPGGDLDDNPTMRTTI